MMLEKLKYRNHMGEIIDFGENGIYVNSNELHDYSWSVIRRNKRIAKLTREVQQKRLPVVVICPTPAEGVEAANRLLEIAEKDCLSGECGRLIVGDYYCECFITASEKTDYFYNRRYMRNNLTIETDRPYWVKETTTLFRKEDESENAFFDFPTDYPYDYRNGLLSQTLNNTNFVESDFVLTIYGEAVNPRIVIGGHVYQVNVTVNQGEYLTIDSAAKTIILTSDSGVKTSKFNLRNRNSYIFQKIPAGSMGVSWDGDWSFDVTVKEARAEPKWTLT